MPARPVIDADENDAPDFLRQSRIDMGRTRAGVDVARMGDHGSHKAGIGRCVTGRTQRVRVETVVQTEIQFISVRRVK